MRLRLIENVCGSYAVQVMGPDAVWDTSRTFTDFRDASEAYEVLRMFHGADIKILAECAI